ncbi:MAG TPA: DUF4375 domain-containing protein [Vicinamibacterales bacterium]|nr:DUF4375 domain-containing protein [Vicinamibacterales bacterium]
MRLDSAQIAGLPDKSVVQILLEAVLAEIGDRHAEALDVVAAMPLGYGVVFSVINLDAEVRNGGFLQYFFNTRLEFEDLVVDGLERIDAGEYLEIFDAACERIGEELERLRPMWEEGLAGFFASYKTSTMSEIDKRWFKLPHIEAKLISCIRQNLADFDATRQES